MNRLGMAMVVMAVGFGIACTEEITIEASAGSSGAGSSLDDAGIGGSGGRPDDAGADGDGWTCDIDNPPTYEPQPGILQSVCECEGQKCYRTALDSMQTKWGVCDAALQCAWF